MNRDSLVAILEVVPWTSHNTCRSQTALLALLSHITCEHVSTKGETHTYERGLWVESLDIEEGSTNIIRVTTGEHLGRGELYTCTLESQVLLLHCRSLRSRNVNLHPRKFITTPRYPSPPSSTRPHVCPNTALT